MINSVVLVGRLTRDPELRYTTTQKAVASFGLAVDRRFKGPSGEKMTDFFNVTAWGKTAELVNQYMKKGRMVGIQGRVEMQKYTAKDGTERTAVNIVADQVMFLDSGRQQGAGDEAPPFPPGEYAPAGGGGGSVSHGEPAGDVMDDGDLPF